MAKVKKWANGGMEGSDRFEQSTNKVIINKFQLKYHEANDNFYFKQIYATLTKLGFQLTDSDASGKNCGPNAMKELSEGFEIIRFAFDIHAENRKAA